MTKLFRRTNMSQRYDQWAGQKYLKLVCAVVLIGIPATSTAYVGPGAGLTMLGALWAVVLAVVFVLGGLLLWPVRAMLRRRKGDSQAVSAKDETSTPAKQKSGDS